MERLDMLPISDFFYGASFLLLNTPVRLACAQHQVHRITVDAVYYQKIFPYLTRSILPVAD
ncbi:MAG: hypothetical protein ACQETM_04130, partial [Bacteroidota bacterium]